MCGWLKAQGALPIIFPARLRLEHSAGELRLANLIANKDKEIARLETAYTANVEKSGARIVKTRAVFEDRIRCGSRPARR